MFKKVVEPGNVVIDLGANIGYFTLLAAKLVGEAGQVYAFEPEPRNFAYLKKNIEINAYANVIAEEKAVSDRNGKTKLFICSYDSGHHTINQLDGIEAYSRGRQFERDYIEVDVVALDDFLEGRAERVDVIKIDVEGAEELAISGMENILKNNKNIKIFLEFFPILIEKMGSSPQGFIESLLGDFGFMIHAIGHDYSMENYGAASLLRIKDYDQLKGLLQDRFAHINPYLSRADGDS
jgi:FkbM family methyltransferase